MKLIGMLDSPYVRRVAISLKFMGIHFSHEPISVFSQFLQFADINPVVKAPTLVTDEGVVLMDSGLILEYVERLAPASLTLTAAPEHFLHAQRLLGLALIACEKTVQAVYERNLRPPEKLHQPWLRRVTGQLEAAFDLIENEIGSGDNWLFSERPLQADIGIAVAWRFKQLVLADAVPSDRCPKLQRFSELAERLPEFSSTPPL